MLFDVTDSSMTNGENPVADGAVGPVHILTDASERLPIIFPYPSVVLQFLQPQSKSRVSMTGDTEHGSHCMDPETSVSRDLQPISGALKSYRRLLLDVQEKTVPSIPYSLKALLVTFWVDQEALKPSLGVLQ